MPYIAGEDREELDPTSALTGSQREATTPGELTFQLTCLVDGYLAGNLDFQAIAEVLGALEATKLELYRRIVAPYEDVKIDLNGDVYETQVRRSMVKKP